MIIDLYAGPGGWDQGMRTIGITDVVGVEWEPNACATAAAAGHTRIRADVSRPPIRPDTTVAGLLASPPCQAWSMAGNRQGELDRARVHNLIDTYAAGSDHIGTGWADPRSHHAAQPVRWVRDLRPEWVCLEQVPAVIALWEHIARVMRGWGYRTWTGVLNAADYGVPQTRQRAILIASRVQSVGPPPATHAQVPGPADLFGTQLRPWVSMAEALGWGMNGRPSMTVTGGGAATGGAEPFGNAARQGMTREADAGRWVQRSNYSAGGPGETAEERGRTIRELDEPSVTLTGKGFQWALRNGTQANAAVRPADPPAGTLFFGARLNNVSWVLRAGAQDNSTVRDLDEPAPTITAGHDTANRVWQDGAQSVRVSVQEAAVLQSFPPDYPWQGTKTAQYLQVGNAIPPLLAAHIVAAATGVDGPAT